MNCQFCHNPLQEKGHTLICHHHKTLIIFLYDAFDKNYLIWTLFKVNEYYEVYIYPTAIDIWKLFEANGTNGKMIVSLPVTHITPDNVQDKLKTYLTFL